MWSPPTIRLVAFAFCFIGSVCTDTHNAYCDNPHADHSHADNWPQASGPNANWKVPGKAPIHWSVVEDKNIQWRVSLPEGGQSTVTVWEDKAFLTTHKPIHSAAEIDLSTDIVGYCLDLDSGKIQWTVELPGAVAVGTAGVFSDATVFAPVTDGKHVWFFNRSGSIGCYDMQGHQAWLREYTPRNRHTNRQCEPILIDGQILVVEVLDKEAATKLKRHAGLPENVDPKSVWTYLHSLDAATGKVRWVEPIGTVIHNTPMIGRRSNGDWAVLHARGGPHKPLETPYGFSLTSLASGDPGTTIWSTEIPNLNPMLNNHWDSKHAYAFTGEYHLILDVNTGQVLSRQSLRKNVDLWSHVADSGSRKLQRGVDLPGKKPRLNTYHTNIVVGDWHYFLAHDRNAIGRVNLQTSKVEYLDLPYQLSVTYDGSRTEIWDGREIIPSIPVNVRGISLVKDKRSTGSGWGHVSAASPILVGNYLYFPMMSGTVYVIDTQAAEFSEKAIAAINDLGPAGKTWTLSSLSYANQRLYARTANEVICIGD
ncbi:PQQ-like domain-containing protein [Neorhodopirellula lusitana]|uniref:PQQ-like domain-containing protein n=1 Tax=Neorhodopirellula lusitana TaxID=445327 RepID=A0ABY1QBD8_9BACT|nr:hypothetical protein [Neorhodopirellula lusitana]SMP66531.1 PQQ-like domain-containing protein [Neorhodopirellula lusitana]